MFGKGIKLFKLLGFEVRIDLSWLVLAVLITWSLAQGLFPVYYKNFSPATYWWMGVAGAIGLFLSIVLHELSHSLVAKAYGIPMKGITLFIFGGVSEMSDEPDSAKAEFLMAIAGPASSIVFGGVFWGIALVGQGVPWPLPVHGVLRYLAVINIVLAAFNLIPAFPLDGGRVLRSVLWAWKGNVRWATRVASLIGSGFGLLLIVLGIMNFIGGNLLAGMWWFLIGLFLRNASQVSYRQMVIRKALEGETVEQFMQREPVTVTPSISLDQLVDDYIYKYHYKMYPVVQGEDQLLGCINLNQLKEIPREEWAMRHVADVLDTCSSDNIIELHADAVKALAKMRRTGNSRLMVVDNGRLEGIITLKDMLDFLALKMDLEDENGKKPEGKNSGWGRQNRKSLEEELDLEEDETRR